MRPFCVHTRLNTVLLFATLSAASVSAQTSNDAPAPQPGSVAPAYTIRSGTQLVVLDVIVKDKKGNIVHNLKPTDFLVKENGTQQTIRDFEEHTAITPDEKVPIPARPNLPPGQFTNYVATPPNGALNIILYDANNTSVKDQTYMRQQLLAYLRKARPDSRTAIFALTTHLIELQGFTSDPAQLLAAIEKRQQAEQSLLRDNITGGLQDAPSSGIFGNAVSHDTQALGLGALAVNMLDNSDTAVQANQDQLRAATTLDGLNDLARFLATIPGRKNLIWFAGDFPPTFFPSENSTDGPYAATAALDDEFRDTVNLLARAQIAVYPIDASALRTDQSNNASVQNAPSRITPGSFSNSTIAPSASTLEGKNLQQHLDEYSFVDNEHLAMKQIARDTGGEAFYNHNDLTRMVREAIDDGANYYTLTYDPHVTVEKDGLRTVSVKVNGESYQLSYRHGYYADRSHRIAAANGPAVAPPSALNQALEPGSPEPTQILLRAKAEELEAHEEPKLIPTNNPNPDPRKFHGPFTTFQISTAASILGMSFSHGDDNIYHTNVDFVTNVYDISGTLINSQSNTIRTAYTKEKLAAAMRSGLLFNQQVTVPAKGEYFLRIAVHDSTSGHVGAIEIPTGNIPQPAGSTQSSIPAAAKTSAPN